MHRKIYYEFVLILSFCAKVEQIMVVFASVTFERRQVEAGRIELPSETQSRSASTCVFRTLNSPLQLLRTGSYNDYSTKFKIHTADE